MHNAIYLVYSSGLVFKSRFLGSVGLPEATISGRALDSSGGQLISDLHRRPRLLHSLTPPRGDTPYIY